MPHFTKEEQEKLVKEWKEFCRKWDEEHKDDEREKRRKSTKSNLNIKCL